MSNSGQSIAIMHKVNRWCDDVRKQIEYEEACQTTNHQTKQLTFT
jgi:hypothetical protein